MSSFKKAQRFLKRIERIERKNKLSLSSSSLLALQLQASRPCWSNNSFFASLISKISNVNQKNTALTATKADTTLDLDITNQNNWRESAHSLNRFILNQIRIKISFPMVNEFETTELLPGEKEFLSILDVSVLFSKDKKEKESAVVLETADSYNKTVLEIARFWQDSILKLLNLDQKLLINQTLQSGETAVLYPQNNFLFSQKTTIKKVTGTKTNQDIFLVPVVYLLKENIINSFMNFINSDKSLRTQLTSFLYLKKEVEKRGPMGLNWLKRTIEVNSIYGTFSARSPYISSSQIEDVMKNQVFVQKKAALDKAFMSKTLPNIKMVKKTSGIEMRIGDKSKVKCLTVYPLYDATVEKFDLLYELCLNGELANSFFLKLLAKESYSAAFLALQYKNTLKNVNISSITQSLNH